jgi:hypothetical protein
MSGALLRRFARSERLPKSNTRARQIARSVIVLGHARFTILTPQLIRVESAADIVLALLNETAHLVPRADTRYAGVWRSTKCCRNCTNGNGPLRSGKR